MVEYVDVLQHKREIDGISCCCCDGVVGVDFVWQRSRLLRKQIMDVLAGM
jgi:hypothetical protein